jgi:hypothetical protein
MQMKVAEEFALKMQEYGKAMYFEGWHTQTSNWAKFPLLLVNFCRPCRDPKSLTRQTY